MFAIASRCLPTRQPCTTMQSTYTLGITSTHAHRRAVYAQTRASPTFCRALSDKAANMPRPTPTPPPNQPFRIGPYLELLRLDRPVGTWLLFLPCSAFESTIYWVQRGQLRWRPNTHRHPSLCGWRILHSLAWAPSSCAVQGALLTTCGMLKWTLRLIGRRTVRLLQVLWHMLKLSPFLVSNLAIELISPFVYGWPVS